MSDEVTLHKIRKGTLLKEPRTIFYEVDLTVAS
jgi:hypothetical protein